MRAPTPYALVVCFAILAAACDSSSGDVRGPSAPTAPSAPTGPGSPVNRHQPVLIASGVDGTPVAEARVTINGDEFYSAANGEVIPDVYSGADIGAEIDVDAKGFLPRRTRLTADRKITLWPVAGEAEAAAVREMVYRRGGATDGVLTPPAPSEFYVTLNTASAEVRSAWRDGAAAFFSVFDLSHVVSESFQYEANELQVLFGGSARCAPVSIWGFCRVTSDPYVTYQVLAERALHTSTIRRVLASFFLGPNPLPGLMNVTSPSNDLSAFERQTIRMILQRKLPNQWPDSDR